ncbi:MAG: hypothetical protein LCI00_23250 [Chloroflexi bacterium]|nr:hypothetical protein [Chloroflexota bacterium]MCC6895971.1 hypothetical protein [Anaerolineae bacterium]
MQPLDPTSLRSPDDEPERSVSYIEFYDEHLMTQEIEALTIISSTQEVSAVERDDDITRA